MWVELLTIFAIWRVSSLFTEEDGPYFIFKRMRKIALKNKIMVFDCFWCTSIWVSIPFAVFTDHVIISWLGLSGMAIFVNMIIEKNV